MSVYESSPCSRDPLRCGRLVIRVSDPEQVVEVGWVQMESGKGKTTAAPYVHPLVGTAKGKVTDSDEEEGVGAARPGYLYHRA